MSQTNFALGGMEIHLTEKESETFYSMITTTNMWESKNDKTQHTQKILRQREI